jgi:tRNA(fMet)-specific endonuclease VapC
MKYLLDTDTASYFIRGVPGVVSTALREMGNWCISSITYAEISSGLFQTKSRIVEIAVTDFLDGVQVVDFKSHDALEAGRLLAKLKAAGNPIGNFDTLIAAHALSLKLTLVTNNTKHFGKVKELTLVNWLADS